jgi:hypothetical protein
MDPSILLRLQHRPNAYKGILETSDTACERKWFNHFLSCEWWN